MKATLDGIQTRHLGIRKLAHRLETTKVANAFNAKKNAPLEANCMPLAMLASLTLSASSNDWFSMSQVKSCWKALHMAASSQRCEGMPTPSETKMASVYAWALNSTSMCSSN